jgi:hypothetical protein
VSPWFAGPLDIDRHRRALLSLEARREDAPRIPVYRADDALTRSVRGTGRVAEALHL